MKSFLIATGAVALSAALAAQTPSPAAAPPTHLSAAAQMQSQYNQIKSNLTKLADKMPDEGCAFTPVNETRTFAQGVGHVDLEKTLATKADAKQALRESFAFCDEFMTHLSPESLAATYTGTSVRGTERTPIQIERGGLAGNLIAHNNEMYGYLAVYLRMKGLVPPSSEGRAGRGGAN